MDEATRRRAAVTAHSYDLLADEYVARIYGELAGKPLDRHLLARFAESVAGRGTVADVGCGPGHVARWLHERGVRMIGADLSPAMIGHARRLSPGIGFDVADMRALPWDDGSLAGLVAFYSLIHIDERDLPRTLAEFHRVLAPGGLALVAFHVGDETRHFDELWGRARSTSTSASSIRPGCALSSRPRGCR